MAVHWLREYPKVLSIVLLIIADPRWSHEPRCLIGKLHNCFKPSLWESARYFIINCSKKQKEYTVNVIPKYASSSRMDEKALVRRQFKWEASKAGFVDTHNALRKFCPIYCHLGEKNGHMIITTFHSTTEKHIPCSITGPESFSGPPISIRRRELSSSNSSSASAFLWLLNSQLWWIEFSIHVVQLVFIMR